MRTKKTPILAAAGALLGSLALPGIALAGEKDPPPSKSPCFDVVLEEPSSANKVSLCHFTGGTNFVLNEPSVSAFVPHTSHHGDCYKFLGLPQVCIP
jgi:hypothetical protein